MAHVRKPKLMDERFERYAKYLIADPCALKGRWRTLKPDAREVHVDLGCGKGLWATRVAKEHPDCLFVGIDYERMCVSFAMERAAAEGLANVFFVFDAARSVADMFGAGEVDVLHVNFPTPFPRKKQAHNRVTDGRRLVEYRDVLGAAGELHLKTDSQPFFDFTVEQLVETGYETTWLTRDMHNAAAQSGEGVQGGAQDAAAPSAVAGEGPTPYDLTMSAYEERLLGEGAHVHALHARVGAAPDSWRVGENVSLVEYLPEDLESLDYVPHGMQGAVENMLNRKRNAEARALRSQ